MDFKEATDRITSLCVTLDDVAKAVGRESSSVRKARLDPESSGHRSPPPDWRAALIALSRERAAALLEFAGELARG